MKKLLVRIRMASGAPIRTKKKQLNPLAQRRQGSKCSRCRRDRDPSIHRAPSPPICFVSQLRELAGHHLKGRRRRSLPFRRRGQPHAAGSSRQESSATQSARGYPCCCPCAWHLTGERRLLVRARKRHRPVLPDVDRAVGQQDAQRVLLRVGLQFGLAGVNADGRRVWATTDLDTGTDQTPPETPLTLMENCRVV